ncbi:hypothetical protein ACFX15_039135 [Malus domestica]
MYEPVIHSVPLFICTGGLIRIWYMIDLTYMFREEGYTHVKPRPNYIRCPYNIVPLEKTGLQSWFWGGQSFTSTRSEGTRGVNGSVTMLYLANRRGTRGVGTTTSRPDFIKARRSLIVLSNNLLSGFSA